MVFRRFTVGGRGENQMDDKMLRDVQAKVYGDIAARYGKQLEDSRDMERQESMDFYNIDPTPMNDTPMGCVTLIVESAGNAYVNNVRVSGSQAAVDTMVEILELETSFGVEEQ